MAGVRRVCGCRFGRSGGRPAEIGRGAVNIASDEPMPGLIQGFRLMVPAQMLHLAALSGRLNAKLDLQLERAAPGSKSWRT